LESFEVEEEGRGGENKSADGSTFLELHGWLCGKEDDNYIFEIIRRKILTEKSKHGGRRKGVSYGFFEKRDLF
jgi:hypothetical protein